MFVPHTETYVPSFVEIPFGVREGGQSVGEFLIGFQNESGLIGGRYGSFCLKPIKKALPQSGRAFVVMSGFEPPTHGFSVRCSTN